MVIDFTPYFQNYLGQWLSLKTRCLIKCDWQDKNEHSAEKRLSLLVDFFNRLITADTHPLLDGQMVYSLLLSAVGKYQYDFFMLPIDDTIWLDTEKTQAMGLIKELKKYVLRKPIAIEMLDGSIDIGAILTANMDKPRIPAQYVFSDMRLSGHLLKHTTVENFLPKLYAWRGYQYMAVAKSPPNSNPYGIWRILNGFAESSDYQYGQSMPIEYQAEKIGAIALNKGCFVGQEVTVRMAHRLAKEQKLKKILHVKIGLPTEPVPESFSPISPHPTPNPINHPSQTSTNPNIFNHLAFSKPIGQWLNILPLDCPALPQHGAAPPQHGAAAPQHGPATPQHGAAIASYVGLCLLPPPT